MSDSYIGKHLLIGISFVDANDELLEQFQTHGKIILINSDEGIVVEKADGSGLYRLPPQLESLDTAPPGEYRLRSTGEVVVNPDYITSWTVEKTRDDTLDEYKAHGFGPFQTSKQ